MATYTMTFGPSTDASWPVRRAFTFACVSQADRDVVTAVMRDAGWTAPGWDKPGLYFECVTTESKFAGNARSALARAGVSCVGVDQTSFVNTPNAAVLAAIYLSNSP